MRMAVAFYVTGISTPELHPKFPPLLGTLTSSPHGRWIGDDPLESAPPHQAHGRVAVDVVPDGTHGLFKGPCCPPRPLQVVHVQLSAEDSARFGCEQMPGSNKV